MQHYGSPGPISLELADEAGADHCPNCVVPHRRGLKRTDRVLAPAREPRIGAHIVTPRTVYTHHGIYVGEGRVVHYAGLSHGVSRGPVEEVSLAQFARGRDIWVRSDGSSFFNPEEVIRRARVRLGENRYHPLKNNCEHFCEWCVHGEPRSYQIDELFTGWLRAFLVLLELRAPAIKVVSRWWDLGSCPDSGGDIGWFRVVGRVRDALNASYSR